MIPRCVAALLLAAFLATGCGSTDRRDARGGGPEEAVAGPLLVLASSGTIQVMEELRGLWEADSVPQLRVVHGSTAALAAQLRAGAPADVVLMAEPEPLDALIDEGLVTAGSRTELARGRLALVVPPGESLPTSLQTLRDARFRLIAIANPEHAPFGAAARALLESRGLLPEIEDRLLLGENAAQALQFVATGNADAGLVAAGLLGEGVGAGLPSRSLASSSDRLLHVAGRVADSRRPEAAARLLSFLASGPAREVLSRRGFDPPDA